MNGIYLILVIIIFRSLCFSQIVGNDAPSHQAHLDTSIIQSCFLGSCIAYAEFGENLSLEISFKHLMFCAVYTDVTEFNLGGPTPSERTNEYSLGAGTKANYKFGYFSVSGGISYAHFIRRGNYIGSSGIIFTSDNYEQKQYYGIGLVIRGNVVVKLFYFGLGIQLMANLNTLNSIIGIAPVLYIGTYTN